MNTTTTPGFHTSKKTTHTIKDIVLKGVDSLTIVTVCTTYNVVKQLNPKTNKPSKVIRQEMVAETIEPLVLNLVEITPEQLDEKRKNGTPSFVLKTNGNFYYSEIPDKINLMSFNLLGHHQCAVVNKECSRLNAASDENGGCARIRDQYERIEKYPWITTGYQTFNTKHDCFFVIDCEHYIHNPRPTFTMKEINRLKLGLAQHMWDDVETSEDVRRRVEENEKK